MKPLKPADLEKLLPALLLVVAITFLSVLLMDQFGGAEKVRAMVEATGAWAPVVFVLLKASTYVIAPLSGTPMKIVAGALFGLWYGLLLTTLGDILGGTLNFWIARLLGRPGIRRFAGAKAIAKVDETTEHVGGWRALLAARILLAGLYDFISYAAGLSNLPFKHFFWVTVVGGIPGAFVWVFIGDKLLTGPGALYWLAGTLVVGLIALGLQRFWKDKTD